MKKKGVAGVLALLFGLWGVHRFYLGERIKGFLMIALFAVTMVITIEEGVPAIMAPAIIGLIDAILFFAMPREDFDEKYNKNKIAKHSSKRPAKVRYRQSRAANNPTRKNSNPYKASGIEKYKDYDYEAAIEDFKKSLNIKYNDPAVHFNLACCYSIMEEVENSFFHLDKAVDYGFVDFERIQKHDALAYIRTKDQFEQFVSNNYQLKVNQEIPKEDLLSQPHPLMDNEILEKIAGLGELRDKGFLTDEEFSKQKQRLLNQR